MRPDRFAQSRGGEFVESAGRERDHPFGGLTNPSISLAMQPSGFREYWPTTFNFEAPSSVVTLVSRRPRYYRRQRSRVDGINLLNNLTPAHYEQTIEYRGPQRLTRQALIGAGFSQAVAIDMETKTNNPITTVVVSENASNVSIGFVTSIVVTETSIVYTGNLGSSVTTLEGEMVEFIDYASQLYDNLLRLSDFPTSGVGRYHLIAQPFLDYNPTEFVIGTESFTAFGVPFPALCSIAGDGFGAWQVRKTLMLPLQNDFADFVFSTGGSGTRDQNVGGAIIPPNNRSLSCNRSIGVEVLNPPPLDLVLANIPHAADESPYSWTFFRYGTPPMIQPVIAGLPACNP